MSWKEIVKENTEESDSDWQLKEPKILGQNANIELYFNSKGDEDNMWAIDEHNAELLVAFSEHLLEKERYGVWFSMRHYSGDDFDMWIAWSEDADVAGRM